MNRHIKGKEHELHPIVKREVESHSTSIVKHPFKNVHKLGKKVHILKRNKMKNKKQPMPRVNKSLPMKKPLPTGIVKHPYEPVIQHNKFGPQPRVNPNAVNVRGAQEQHIIY